MKIKEIIIFISFLIPFAATAQEFGSLRVPVFHENIILANPFTGGFDAPQFNQLDIDLDGTKDLIVFDRKTYLVSIFLFEDGKYIYTEDYNEVFPDLKDWVLIRDFDGDGIGDLFTAPKLLSNHAIAVWKGSIRNGNIVFEKLDFPYGTGEVLSYRYFGNEYSVYVARTDIPVIHDLDQDGDLDILAFESGGGTVNHFNNLCIEEGLALDSFKIGLADRCWGQFRESILDETIILSDDPNECASGSGFRHAGSTMNVVDLDGDSDLDVLLGDSEYSGIIMIENGNKEKAHGIAIERDFPQADVPVDLPWFLGTYFIEPIEGNGLKMIVTPNTDIGAKNHRNIWLYKDTDPSENIDFSFVQEDFLQDETVDWGSEIYPSFVDIDQDGLMDIVLGTSGLTGINLTVQSGLIYYRNSGTADKPSFTLVTDDFLSLKGTWQTHLAPAFGDLNGDGATDLILGTNNGKLIYYQNFAEQGKPFEFGDPVNDYMDIEVGFNALPLIFDVNRDGLEDLVIGNYNSYTINNETGSLACFINTGEPGIALFNSDPEAPPNIAPFGNIALHENNFNRISQVRPYTYSVSTNKKMLVGSVRGNIGLYEMVGEEPVLLTDSLYNLDMGKFSAPAIEDIDYDGYFELLVGTNAGGLRLYDTEIESELTGIKELSNNRIQFEVFPNPANQNKVQVRTNISPDQSSNPVIRIQDLFGRTMCSAPLLSKITSLDITGISAGYYVIAISNGSMFSSKPLIIIH